MVFITWKASSACFQGVSVQAYFGHCEAARIWGISYKSLGNFLQGFWEFLAKSEVVLAEKKELLGGFLKRKIVAE